MSNTPDAFFTFMPDSGTPIKVFMSFGLLSRLASFVGESTHLPQLFSDIELQNVILSELLSPREEDGTIKTRLDPMSPVIQSSIEEGHRLMTWVSEHLADFFVKRLHATLQMQNRMMTQMKA